MARGYVRALEVALALAVLAGFAGMIEQYRWFPETDLGYLAATLLLPAVLGCVVIAGAARTRRRRPLVAR